jgi:hypothetical protein
VDERFLQKLEIEREFWRPRSILAGIRKERENHREIEGKQALSS